MGAVGILKQTASEWSQDRAPQQAAALAYYAVFSGAPLLLIAVAIAGLALGQEEARQKVMQQVEGQLGRQPAEMLGTAMANMAKNRGGNIFAIVIGGVVVLLGASGAFGQLQSAMNDIWDVRPRKGQGVKGMVRKRLATFLMVLFVGLLFLGLLALSAAVSALHKLVPSFPGGQWLWTLIELGVSILAMAVLVGAIFKLLPDVEIQWRDVWLGALITAVLLAIGKTLIGLYLGHSSTASVYGAAGSLILLLLWLYYSGLIFFFGAEFVQVYAGHRGRGIRPDSRAEWRNPQEHEQERGPEREKT